jgi:hypothetical protein
MLCKDLRAIQIEVANAERVLATKRFAEKRIAEDEIPGLMLELGIDDITVDGKRIEIERDIRTSQKNADVHGYQAWLVANGHGAVVKDTVFVQFAAGDHEKADKLSEKLAGDKLPVERSMKVETATLKALLRRLTTKKDEDGRIVEIENHGVPLEMFGAYKHRRAVVR